MDRKHVRVVKQGAEAIAKWRIQHSDEVMDLSGIDLCGVDLRDADLAGANLERSCLQNAELCSANLRGANLHDANLRGANLQWGNLRGANLQWGNLRGANLHDAILYEAHLKGATLYDANLRGAYLIGADLGGAKGILSIGPGGSRGDMLYAVKHDKGPMVMTGCFWDTLSDFEVAVEREHGDGEHGRYYRVVIELIREWSQGGD